MRVYDIQVMVSIVKLYRMVSLIRQYAMCLIYVWQRLGIDPYNVRFFLESNFP